MKQTLIVLILLYAGILNAQDSHMAINMGVAAPIGDFSSAGKFLENGYTDPGFNLTVDANYIPTWYFGIGANISLSTFALNDDLVKRDLIKLIEQVPEIPGLDTVTNFSIGAWSYANFLIGPVLSLPAGKFQFNLKALGGLSILMPTDNAITFIYEGEEYVSYNEPQNARWGMLLGTDIIYKLSGSYSLKVGADYFRSKTNYDVKFDYVDSELATLKSDVQVQALHLTLGIAYLF